MWLRVASWTTRGLSTRVPLSVPFADQELVEGGHRRGGRVAAATRHACRAPLGRVDRLGDGWRCRPVARRVHIGAAVLQLVRHADAQIVEPERIEQIVPDHLAVVAAGDRLDQGGQHPVRGQAVVFHPRAGLPLEREAADLVAQPGVVGPGRQRDGRVGEAALVGDDLLDGDQPLAVAGELRDMIGDRVGEGERALIDQLPDRRAHDRLGLREEQPEGLVGGRGRRVDARPAERAEAASLPCRAIAICAPG